MDPYLIALARAAENGENCPVVRLVLQSGDLVIGQPTKSRYFVDSTFTGLRQEAAAELGRRPRKQRKDDPGDANTLANTALRPMNVNVDVTEPHYLTLSSAQVFWGGRADGVNARAIRVALAGVMLWWITGATEFKGSGGGYGVGIGAIFPMD
jgi:hypothetical protein